MLETAWEDRWLPDQKKNKSESSRHSRLPAIRVFKRIEDPNDWQKYLENFIQRKMIRKS